MIGHATKKFGEDLKNIKVFCDVLGKMIPKKKMIESMQAAWNLTGALHVRLSGHSLRRSGAQYLAALGMELMLIQVLGRWGSTAIERYVAESPLNKLTEKFKTLRASRSLAECRLKALEMTSPLDSTSSETDVRKAIKNIIEDGAIIDKDAVNAEMNDIRAEIHILRELVADDVERITKELAISKLHAPMYRE